MAVLTDDNLDEILPATLEEDNEEYSYKTARITTCNEENIESLISVSVEISDTAGSWKCKIKVPRSMVSTIWDIYTIVDVLKLKRPK